jgi:hypothetical protein
VLARIILFVEEVMSQKLHMTVMHSSRDLVKIR